jgi:hypothetical protein
MSSTADPVVVAGATSAERPIAWLHGVARDVEPERLATISGLDGHPVRPVRAAGLTAVVSRVPMSAYGEEALRRNLEDLAWLERTARTHHRVVDALFRGGPVVPARLATVYHDDERVAAVLRERRAQFAATLDRLAGRTEWGVKGYVVPGAAAARSEPTGAGGAGAAYLRRRRAQLLAREEGQQAAARDAALVHQALSARAQVARRHPPQDRRLSGAAAAMVLNGAYLVDSARAAEFTELVETLSARHPAIRLQLTGPWPPYSFAAGDPPEEAAAEDPR